MISVKEIEFKYGGEYTLKVDSRELDDGEKNTEYKYIKEFSLVVNSLKLESGKSLAITGVSGSGKSTLLKVLSAELTPTKGDISVLDQNLYKMKESERRNFRLKNFGMIFQDSPLLEYLTVSENILLPAEISGVKVTMNIQQLAKNCGIENLLNRYPAKLSEGEKQRAAICRSLITSPKLVLADEPTSSLDPVRGGEVTDLLIQSCQKQKCSLVMVTHDHTLLSKFDKTVDMSELRGNHD